MDEERELIVAQLVEAARSWRNHIGFAGHELTLIKLVDRLNDHEWSISNGTANADSVAEAGTPAV